jgi:hypothetical protein
MDKGLVTFASIMLFYAVLACVLTPLVFYFIGKRSLKVAGHGFLVGSVLSMVLWVMYGSKMV